MKKHTDWCRENAEISVRENCQDRLTAEAWDRAAMDAENEWVQMCAAEWLIDGTATCVCDY